MLQFLAKIFSTNLKALVIYNAPNLKLSVCKIIVIFQFNICYITTLITKNLPFIIVIVSCFNVTPDRTLLINFYRVSDKVDWVFMF